MSSAVRERVDFRAETINIRVGHQKNSCAFCKRPVPIELLSQAKVTPGWCLYCVERFSTRAMARRINVIASKIDNTIVRHSKRLGIDTVVLREEYGWDRRELIRMFEDALKQPCLYCKGLRYGELGTPLGVLKYNRISLDLYLSGEPYLANMRWCCAMCNCVKRNLDPKTWQLYCTYFPKWLREFYDIKKQELDAKQSSFLND